MLTLVIAGLTAVLDQIVKLIVQGNMELGETIPLIRNVFHLTSIREPPLAYFRIRNGSSLALLLYSMRHSSYLEAGYLPNRFIFRQGLVSF